MKSLTWFGRDCDKKKTPVKARPFWEIEVVDLIWKGVSLCGENRGDVYLIFGTVWRKWRRIRCAKRAVALVGRSALEKHTVYEG